MSYRDLPRSWKRKRWPHDAVEPMEWAAGLLCALGLFGVLFLVALLVALVMAVW